MEFPLLYARNKNGTIKEWRISVKDALIEIEYGQEGGKKIIQRRVIEKANTRHETPEKQALFMAESKWKHKKEREGYSETKECTVNVFPMLAQTFQQGKHVVFPCFVQPKIDGLRCIARRTMDGKIELRSRTNVLFDSASLEPVRQDLKKILSGKKEGVMFDGELYSNELSFEELSGKIRRQQDCRETIYYIVFDVVSPDQTFEERFQTCSFQETEHVKKLETRRVDTITEIMEYHQEATRRGYEGTIIRNRKGMYRQGFRSWDLQKHKDFKEEEFVIIGFQEGEGKEKGTVIWECRTENGQSFFVRPRGSLDYRSRLFHQAGAHVGSLLTVIYQERTRDGIPRFPVGKEIRTNY